MCRLLRARCSKTISGVCEKKNNISPFWTITTLLQLCAGGMDKREKRKNVLNDVKRARSGELGWLPA